MKHLAVTIIILMLGFVACGKGETVRGIQSQQTKRIVKYYYYHYDAHDDIETHYIFFDDGTAFDSRLNKLDGGLEYAKPNRTYKEFETWLFFEAGTMSEQEEDFYDDNRNILKQWKIFNYKKR